MPKVIRTCFVVVASLLFYASGAHAANGVIQINQARALAGGVTPLDAPGFPVTIDVNSPGSYMLAGNLTVADPNLDGIEILAEHVTLDLNGFVIAGPVTCSGSRASITCGAGTGIGIDGVLFNKVRNGVVRGFGSGGVELSSLSQVVGINAIENGDIGIQMSTSAVVRNCFVYGNEGAGIQVSFGGNLVHNEAVGNRNNGVQASSGSTMVANTGYSNGGSGLTCGSYCVMNDSAAYSNTEDGIRIGFAAIASGNASGSNTRDQIWANTGSLVIGNAIRPSNSVWGLNLQDATVGYRENVITTFNASGGTITGGVNMGDNRCNGSSICP